MKRLLLAILFFLGLQHAALAASCGSYPFTLQNNTTADATQVMANFNNVRNCVINNTAGSGVNTDITALTGLTTPLSPAQGGTPVFIGGTSTGSADAQVVATTTPIGFSLISGWRLTFVAGFTNLTTTPTLNVNSSGATVIKRVGSAGLEALGIGDIHAGNVIEAIYDGTQFVLLTTPVPLFNSLTTIASATTTDLGTVSSHNVSVTGTTTITGFGSTAVATNPVYYLGFTGALTLTHNAASMILPGGANIVTAAGDQAIAQYLGSGNWRVISYTRASGAAIVQVTPLCGATGLTITNNAGTPNTSIDVSWSSVVMLNSTNGVTFTNNTPTTVTVNSTLSGSVNQWDAARPTSNWGNIFIVSDGTTTGAIGSASATAPTMPSGYVYACRVGAMFFDGSQNLLRTRAAGSWTYYTVVAATNTAAIPTLNVSTSGTCTVGNYTSTTVRGSGQKAPPTATHIDVAVSNQFGAGALASVCVAPNNGYGTQSSSNPPPFALDSGSRSGATGIMQLESNAVFYVSSATGGWLGIRGWKDSVNAN